MQFGPLDLVIVHFIGLFVGLFVLPKFFPNLVEQKPVNTYEEHVDQALNIANRIDPKSK